MKLLFLAVLLLAPAGGAIAAVPDTTDSDVGFSIGPRLDGFYSPVRGFGFGLNATVRNLGWEGSRLHLTNVTMTRHGEYGAFMFSGPPTETPLYGGLGVYYTGTRAYRFSGLGPTTSADDAVEFSARRVEAEARLGWYPAGIELLAIQPAIRLLYANVRSFEGVTEGAFERLTPRDRESVLRAVETPFVGVVGGLSAILDLFDNPEYPHSGAMLQASARRYVGLGDDPFHYWQGSFLAHGAITLVGERGVLEARAVLTITREDDPTGPPLPFFALPTIGNDLVGGLPPYRLVGRDLLVGTVGFRFPVLDVFNWIGAEGFVAVHVANAYDDLFDQFEPRISFARDIPPTDGRAPLRPALSLGGYLVDLGDRLPIVSGQIGLSPEGFELAGLEFVIDLRRHRPPVR